MIRRTLLVFVAFVLASLPLSAQAESVTETDMTIVEYMFSDEDVGQIVIKVSPVPGNPLARDYTITNELIVYEKLKEDQWIFLAGSGLFPGTKKITLQSGEEQTVLDFLGLDSMRSLVSRKTVRAVRKYELADEGMQVYLQGYMSTASVKKNNGIRFIKDT